MGWKLLFFLLKLSWYHSLISTLALLNASGFCGWRSGHSEGDQDILPPPSMQRWSFRASLSGPSPGFKEFSSNWYGKQAGFLLDSLTRVFEDHGPIIGCRDPQSPLCPRFGMVPLDLVLFILGNIHRYFLLRSFDETLKVSPSKIFGVWGLPQSSTKFFNITDLIFRTYLSWITSFWRWPCFLL